MRSQDSGTNHGGRPKDSQMTHKVALSWAKTR
jgi:hypothetical protein